MIQTKIENFEQKSKKVIFGGVLSLLALFSLYGYFLHQSIQNVVQREKAEASIAEVSARVSNLEFSYMNKKNSITPELATSLGFEAAQKTIFIASASRGLSFNH